MRLLGRAKVVGITRARSQDGGVLNSCGTGDEGRAGTVVVDVGTDHQVVVGQSSKYLVLLVLVNKNSSILYTHS